MSKTELDRFIEEETLKVKSTAIPVKASLLERLLVRKMSVLKLHPNPEDEFTFPDIGPNLNIISNYTTQFLNNIKRGLEPLEEPLFIQKIRPSGYMVLNGHHRWIAASRLGIKKIPVTIVNAVFDSDIKRMLEKSTHEKRATFDLDEVVFTSADTDPAEKSRGIWKVGLQKKLLRLGIPALFTNLRLRGYDVWVYSSQYYSVDDIRRFFKRYRADVDGIITCVKKQTKKEGPQKKVEEMIKNKYKTTLHIDREFLLITHSGSDDYDEIAVECDPAAWSATVIDALDKAEGVQKDN